MSFTRSFCIWSFLIVVMMSGMSVTAYADMLIGPGSDVGALGTDEGERLNISQGYTTLDAGSYSVNDFSFNAMTASGEVTPFLAIGSPNLYTTLWVGPSCSTTATGINTDTYEDQVFTLTSSENVFAGFYTSADGRVGFNDAGGCAPWSGILDDHDNVFDIPTVGSSIGDFAAANLERTYAFGVNISAATVPEPGTFALLISSLIGGLFISMSRKRK